MFAFPIRTGQLQPTQVTHMLQKYHGDISSAQSNTADKMASALISIYTVHQEVKMVGIIAVAKEQSTGCMDPMAISMLNEPWTFMINFLNSLHRIGTRM